MPLCPLLPLRGGSAGLTGIPISSLKCLVQSLPGETSVHPTLVAGFLSLPVGQVPCLVFHHSPVLCGMGPLDANHSLPQAPARQDFPATSKIGSSKNPV